MSATGYQARRIFRSTVNGAPGYVTATIGSDGSVSGNLLNPDGSQYGVFWGRPSGLGMAGSFDLNT